MLYELYKRFDHYTMTFPYNFSFMTIASKHLISSTLLCTYVLQSNNDCNSLFVDANDKRIVVIGVQSLASLQAGTISRGVSSTKSDEKKITYFQLKELVSKKNFRYAFGQFTMLDFDLSSLFEILSLSILTNSSKISLNI